ncbi:MAG: hypothetical protein AB1814_06365 [Thermodesulfobacteriota bacterium]
MSVSEKKGFFDKPGNFRRFLTAFFAALVVLLLVDFLVSKHGHFSWEQAPEFFAAYGFVSCVVLVLAARVLRRLVKRPEDYYGR